MEPLFFKAENLSNATAHAVKLCASMEPLFFKAENCRWEKIAAARSAASMEPLFFKAENSNSIRNAPSGCWSFNGAAFFQSGKCLEVWRLLPKGEKASMEPLFFKAENDSADVYLRPSSKGLQWSRFFSKRKIKTLSANAFRELELQWSRFFSKRKIARRNRKAKSRLSRFNGAAFFQSGKFSS